MKAQAAVEYLMIVVVVLVISITLFYYSTIYSSESIAISQTQESIKTIANTIDYVYALGPGAETTVEIELPKNVVDSYVIKNEIGFKIGVSGRIDEVYEVTKSSVSGSLPNTPGRHVIFINTTQVGVFIGTP